MALNYPALALTAQRLLEDNGRAVTLVKKNEAVDDPARPWEGGTAADILTAVTAVMVEYQKADMDGELVRRGDQKAFVAELSAPGLSLEDYDLLRDDEGQEWKIVDVVKYRPGATTLVYILQLRK